MQHPRTQLQEGLPSRSERPWLRRGPAGPPESAVSRGPPRNLWRPTAEGSKNFVTSVVIDLNRARKRRQVRRLRVPPIVRLLEQAVEFQRLLDTRQVRFRADLARRSGLSAMRVTQVLALLRLARSIQDYIRALPPGVPPRRVTERGLRALTTLPPKEQVAWARGHLAGFAAFLARRDGAVA